MKILFLINNLSGGGAEKLIFDFLMNNTSKEFVFDILTLNTEKDKYGEKLKKIGFKINKIPHSNPFKIIHFIKLISKNYDIIHSHLFPAFYYLAISKVFSRKFPKIIFTEHSTSNRRRLFRILVPLEFLIYSQFDKIICISQGTKYNLLKWINLSLNRITVIYNGISFDNYEIANRLDINTLDSNFNHKNIIIALIGRLTESKNHLFAFDVLTQLPTYFKLLVVGEGELETSLKRRVDELNLSSRVLFTGFRDDIPSLIQSSQIVFIPSKWEGFGLVAVEALIMGKTIVCSNINGLKEVVGDYAYKFDSNSSVEEVKRILLYAYNNPFNKRDLTLQAEKFNIKNTIKNHLDLYEKL
jgi:glycosyltransferase involved in cell wall biosynthesis